MDAQPHRDPPETNPDPPSPSVDPSVSNDDLTGQLMSRRVAWWSFTILFGMTLLDYMDRNVLSAVLLNLTADVESGGLGLTNEQGGSLVAVFLVSYSVISPLMSWAGDRYRRSRLLFIGVATWSLATVACGFAQSYEQLIVARCFLGFGEATYGCIAPTLLIDLFPRTFRSRLMSLFYLAMPLGGALGITIGGAVASRYGWSWAFLVVGAPGLAIAFLALLLPDPPRGAGDGLSAENLARAALRRAGWSDYLALFTNRSYVKSVLGMAFYTFAIGGLLVWMPKFLTATRGLDQGRATLMLGAITCVAAILGMALGGWLSDKLALTRPGALFVVPGVAMLLAIPFVILGLFAQSLPLMTLGIFAAEVLMFVNTGPCNAAIANVVMPHLRAVSFGVSVFFIHFLGDIWSPVLMGRLADHFGTAEAMATPTGRWLSWIGATPTLKFGSTTGAAENLLAGLLIVLPALLVSGLVLLSGARDLKRDTQKVQDRLRSAG
ncbi:major facilitator superfamily MFS_1 [Isosphaera pallida ATCC 43644]|uniref:Major facilitator superfamily MFS_1 n=1 Tax=Isosphaera pallida (strain ATCC 43644 / DSM 9630 / IS1B) TaxID=575540 RepID=E8R3A4_ISOPI|nr:MFS transporter [Isosphaera pallida]ADV63614.1 major facilitator superfamily MFS_1 [Isosphaera pallida ATCC 43644]